MTDEKVGVILNSRTDDELKQIARDLYSGKIWTDRHDDGNGVHAFLVLKLAGWTREQVEPIGMVFEYLREAGPFSSNGRPSFMSMQLLSIDDTNKMLEYYGQIRLAMESI